MQNLEFATPPRHTRIVLAISAALGLFSGVALAQEAAVAPPADQPATQAPDAATSGKPGPKTTALGTVVVTANKRVENVRKVAASISVIGKSEIEDKHVTQLSDLQASVPGLFVNSNGSPGKTSVSLRGISPQLSSGSTIGSYLDETPLGSSGIYQAANFFSLDLLPYDVGRIEVLRGPQGTLYGAGSMGGLVKYVTVAPDLSETEFRVGGGVSSVENSGDLGWNARFGGNVPLVTDRVGLRFSYARNDLPGYIDNSVNGEKDINSGTQTGARVALLWQGDTASVNLSAMRQTVDSDNNAQAALHPTTLVPLYGDLINNVYVNEKFTKDVDYFSATVNWDLGWADFVSATGYSDTKTFQRQDTTLLYGEFANLALHLPAAGSSYFNLDFSLNKFTQEFRLVSKTSDRFEWMVGTFYTTENAKQGQVLFLNKLDGTPLPPPYNSFGTLAIIEIPSDYKELAFFANGTYKFTDAFKVGAGVRYAKNDQNFSQNVTGGVLLPLGHSPGSSSEGVFTWSLSPQFQLSEHSLVYARVATGYQPGGPNIVTPGLPASVNSSTLTNYEIGYRTESADQRLVFDVTAFYIDWTDIQVGTQVNGIGGLVNAGKATSQGVELSTAYRVTDEFRLGLNAAYTDSKLNDDYPTITIPSGPYLVQVTDGLAGDKLPYVADWSWSGTADYDFELKSGWSAHVGAALRYVGDRKNDTTNVQNILLASTTPPTLLVSTVTPPRELDSYLALDLNASVSNEHWTLRAYAKNVTGERGYQSLTAITSAVTKVTHNFAATPIQPRTFGLEFDYSF